MVSALFMQLPIWFKNVLDSIKRVYDGVVVHHDTSSNSMLKYLSSLRGFVNAKKVIFIDEMNKDIERRRRQGRFAAFSSGVEGDIHDAIRDEILGVEVGDNEPMEFKEDLSFELGDPLQLV